MKQEELVVGHRELIERLHGFVIEKNEDYSGNWNAFLNFEAGEYYKIGTTDQGFGFRLLDKVGRVMSFIRKGVLKVKDESVVDTLLDLANYCLLLILYIKWKRSQKINVPSV